MRRPATPPRPPLTALPAPFRRAPRAPFVVLILAVLTSGLVGLLLLNTALAQGSFRLHDLQRSTAVLQDREQQLQMAVDAAGTPDRLAAAARALGLVPAVDPGFLQLPSGRVLGAPQAAPQIKKKKPVVAASPNVSANPTTKVSAKPATKPAAKTAAKPATKPTTKPAPRPSTPPTRR
jgi:outer membrane biosynthesis protein TonB